MKVSIYQAHKKEKADVFKEENSQSEIKTPHLTYRTFLQKNPDPLSGKNIHIIFICVKASTNLIYL